MNGARPGGRRSARTSATPATRWTAASPTTCVAEASFVGRVPAGLDPLDAAPLTCAGVTTYKAVKVSRTRPSDLVAIFGIGGLGHLAMQYAQIAGGTVAAVDVVEHKLQVAKDLGAAYTVNAATEDPAEVIQALGGADAAIVLAATPAACEAAFRSLRRNGRLVFVGLPADNVMRLPIFETVLKGISITGSIVGTRVDLAETFELHADGRTSVVREQRGARDRQRGHARRRTWCRRRQDRLRPDVDTSVRPAVRLDRDGRVRSRRSDNRAA